MTQYFTYEGFALWKAPLQIRVLVTVFVVVASLGVTVGIVNYQVRTGLTAEGSEAWYRGQTGIGSAGPGDGASRPLSASPGSAPPRRDPAAASAPDAAGEAGGIRSPEPVAGGDGSGLGGRVRDGARQGPLYAKSPLELLDATHPHLFNQAFLFFVLGHLLALCSVIPGVKVTTYLAGFSGVLIDTASPWLIRYVAPEFAYLQLGGHVLMAGAFLILVAVPLREMWGTRARRARAERRAS